MTQEASETALNSDQPEQAPAAPVAESENSGFSRRGLLKGAAVGASLSALGGLVLPTSVAAAAPITQTNVHTPAVVEFPRAGKLREYWVQADSFFHNVIPSGLDGMTGNTFQANQTSLWAIGYRAFTPGWGAPLPGNADIGPNTGIPGPTFRAEVGDSVRVHFRNNNTYYKTPHSISPHGFAFDVNNDGGWSWMLRDRPGTAVEFGQTYTYNWGTKDRSVGTWPYHDHSKHFDPGRGTIVVEAGAELGLVGAVAITDQNTPKADVEFVTVWHTFYQGDIPGISQDFDCFNGLAYLGNTPTYKSKVGQHVRWRVVSLGNDFHTFHVHGHAWQHAGFFTDSVVIGPGACLTLDYIEDNPGIWYYHCHVPMHVMGPGMGGMIGLIDVSA